MKVCHLLVVESDLAFRQELVTAIHELMPHLVLHEASSAEAAVLKLNLHPIQLLIADIALPGTSGIELVMMLRARGNTTAVILLTMQEDAMISCVAELLSVSNVICKSSAFYHVPRLLPALLDDGPTLR